MNKLEPEEMVDVIEKFRKEKESLKYVRKRVSILNRNIKTK
jgi:hypothetical protein